MGSSIETTQPRQKSEFVVFGKDEDGIPDGASVDTEGDFWIAVPGDAQVERRLPDGCLDLAVKTLATYPTVWAIGGENRDQLYITTQSKHLDAMGLADNPDEGALFVAQADYQGLPETPFEPK
ncbi:SMP-30/gluconolactonase/LRE family protein [Ruegeria sp. HKCCD7251]|uniref:SMP-30/gluconolactonase/LRE family protein n=1 Tax=Ruegeria sp. HKCCD7251 TaxID=2683011 RepID=UPI0035304B94